MGPHDCTDTILRSAVKPSLTLSWQGWVADGGRLIVGDVTRVWAIMSKWCERRRSRNALAQLDARLLDDVGLDAGRVRAEIKKPFWKAP